MKKQRAADRYQASNQASAEIILSDPSRYGGEGALPVLWARLVLNPPSERTAPATRRAA